MKTSNHLETATRDFREKVEDVVDKAKEVCDRLQTQTTAAAKATNKAIHEHPYQTVGIAFGVGLLIGLLITRSRRD